MTAHSFRRQRGALSLVVCLLAATASYAAKTPGQGADNVLPFRPRLSPSPSAQASLPGRQVPFCRQVFDRQLADGGGPGPDAPAAHRVANTWLPRIPFQPDASANPRPSRFAGNLMERGSPGLLLPLRSELTPANLLGLRRLSELVEGFGEIPPLMSKGDREFIRILESLFMVGSGPAFRRPVTFPVALELLQNPIYFVLYRPGARILHSVKAGPINTPLVHHFVSVIHQDKSRSLLHVFAPSSHSNGVSVVIDVYRSPGLRDFAYSKQRFLVQGFRLLEEEPRDGLSYQEILTRINHFYPMDFENSQATGFLMPRYEVGPGHGPG